MPEKTNQENQNELLSFIKEQLTLSDAAAFSHSDSIRTINALKTLFIDNHPDDCEKNVQALLQNTQLKIADLIGFTAGLIRKMDIQNDSLCKKVEQYLDMQLEENNALALIKIIALSLLISDLGTEQFQIQYRAFSPRFQQHSTLGQTQLSQRQNSLLKQKKYSNICWSSARFSAYFSIITGLSALGFSMFYKDVGAYLGIAAATLLISALIFHLSYLAIEKYNPPLSEIDDETDPTTPLIMLQGSPHRLFSNNNRMDETLLQALKDEDNNLSNENSSAASSSNGVDILVVN